MTNPIIEKFKVALPKVLQWTDDTIRAHEAQAVPVSSCGFQRLSQCFSPELLEGARVVYVQRVPRPPLSALGLRELAGFESLHLIGITLKNVFFLSQKSESLHFHEMVHVVQWQRLGPERFLLAYGAGLLQWRYENAPFERMAYQLQSQFDRGQLAADLQAMIENQTDAIWTEAAQSFGL